MANTNYTDQKPGRLVQTTAWEPVLGAPAKRIPVPGWAFVPDPLPPVSDPSNLLGSLMNPLLDATAALSKLDGLGRTLPNPHILLYPLMLREAKLSSKIENTIASAEEVVLVEAGETPLNSEAREVWNYVQAVRLGISSELPVCNRLIRDMHQVLMKDVRGEDKEPGAFRNVQAYIGGTSRRFADARFVPPPPGQILEETMDQLEAFINMSRWPSVVVNALTHYQFESIHPFRDGNGRIGRALAAIMLCKGNAPPLSRPLVYLSGFFDHHVEEYYRRLLRVSTHGDWKAWIEFYLIALQNQATDAMGRINRVIALREELVARVTEPKASSLLPKLIDEFFRAPAMKTKQAAAALNVQPQAAQRFIDRLVEKEIVEEVTGGKKDRVWVARRLLQVIEMDTPESDNHPVERQPSLFPNAS